MVLEDLILKRYSVSKKAGKMRVFEDTEGNYKAMSAWDLLDFLTIGKKADNMFIKLGRGQRGGKEKLWHKLG